MTRLQTALAWGGLGAATAVPVAASLSSPLLAWRDPVYILAGLAGVVAMALLLVQPLLAAGALPGLPGPRGRRLHRWVGGGLVVALVVHVAGLWVTSPPDMIDALLFRSPTPFSAWGVVAFWAVLATALLATLRRRLGLRPRTWRRGHGALAATVVGGSAVHAMLIDGTMEPWSKAALCALVVAAAAWALAGSLGRFLRAAPR